MYPVTAKAQLDQLKEGELSIVISFLISLTEFKPELLVQAEM